MTALYGDDFVKSLSTYPKHADDIIKYSKQRGEYFVKRLSQEAKIGDTAVSRLIKKVSVNGKFSRNTILYSNSFTNSVFSLLSKYGYTLDDFNALKLKSVTDYTAKEISFMKSFREAIFAPTESTLMSKAIPFKDITGYLDDGWNQIGGFITKADDVAMCKNYDDYYNMLRLDYVGTEYLPNSDSVLGIIRYTTNEADKIKTPYSSLMSNDSICDNGYPFTGNGFTGSENGTVIPEYWCYKDGATVRCTINDGAELYMVTKNGDEILMGVYNSKTPNPIDPNKNGAFVRLEDIE